MTTPESAYLPEPLNKSRDELWPRSDRRGRLPLIVKNLLDFLEHCSEEEFALPLRPSFNQLPDDVLERVEDVIGIFNDCGLRKPVWKQMRPVLEIIRRVELQEFSKSARPLTEDEFDAAMVDLQGCLCVRWGVLPARDGDIVYAPDALFKDRAKPATAGADAANTIPPPRLRATHGIHQTHSMLI
jgi:hypothetical protein